MNDSLIEGRYRLDHEVGLGASGKVFRATDLVLEREVAVKVVDGTRIGDPTIVERFRREAIATAGLAHPNIVSVYDAGSEGERHHLVMELLSGPSVADLLKQYGQFDLQRVVRIGAQVARGLSAAHAIGLTHRDIKPGNVVKHDSITKIVDFGIARLGEAVWQTLTVASTTVGTAAYMSPEQARGLDVGPPSDVYSLGCLLMTMATGKPPFVDPDPIETARAHTSDVPPRLRDRRPEFPAELDELIDRMLAKDPDDRPSTSEVADALTDLEAQAKGMASPVETREVLGEPESPATPARRHPDDVVPKRRRWWARHGKPHHQPRRAVR
ncbi:serine/threonine-protein kinase [Aestuariimicrobium ganziense]|uniref:serine/threonine-protein kinase n=1 Tax=Aestuariimicrobium ganziense TaxID=2773677 RepID=UPI0019414B48|nr:serine/threonine-protein kinase [Aestuariimicrobium ganziense]